MSKFVTQKDLDQKVRSLQDMDSNSLVSYMLDLFWNYKQSRMRMLDDADDLYEEYMMVRTELGRRLGI